MDNTANNTTKILNFKLNNNGKGQQDQGNDVEEEIMFQKEVKPSDLKRLRISKDNAQKYFDPLRRHSSTNTEDKGFQISFEEDSGKVWQFHTTTKMTFYNT